MIPLTYKYIIIITKWILFLIFRKIIIRPFHIYSVKKNVANTAGHSPIHILVTTERSLISGSNASKIEFIRPHFPPLYIHIYTYIRIGWFRRIKLSGRLKTGLLQRERKRRRHIVILIKSALEQRGVGWVSRCRGLSRVAPPSHESSHDNDTKCRFKPPYGGLWSFNHDPPGYESARCYTSRCPDLPPHLF